MFTVGCKLFKPLTQNQELPKHFICVSNSFPFHIATNYAVYSGNLRTFFIGSLTKLTCFFEVELMVLGKQKYKQTILLTYAINRLPFSISLLVP